MEYLSLQCNFRKVQRASRKSSSPSRISGLPAHLGLDTGSEKMHHELANGSQRLQEGLSAPLCNLKSKEHTLMVATDEFRCGRIIKVCSPLT